MSGEFNVNSQPFALLDDAGAPDGQAPGRSRLYTGYCRELAGVAPDDLDAALRAAWDEGLHALLLVDYDAGAGATAMSARVLLFRSCARLDPTGVAAWLDARVADEAARDDNPACIADVRYSVDEDAFNAALARIRDWLAAGDCYQVNYTFRLSFDLIGAPAALYRQLRCLQPVPFGALIGLPDGSVVLSLSPEQFLRHDGDGLLQARPMKGTARRPADATDAAALAEACEALRDDPKNRAENVMIVDLLRNDLGRIAVPGSVRVPRLFDVDAYGAVLQMTSTVTARPRADVGLGDVLTALFPCGSITGAPKKRTMDIIRALETTPRGLYTGAIGWVDAAPALAPFCLSVAIRTIVADAPRAGVRHAVMGVGAGIVHDSDAADEWRECRLKAGFLLDADAGFTLFETLRVTRAGCALLAHHLERLGRSARYFGFRFDAAAIHARIAGECATLDADTVWRLRLDLARDGTIRLTRGALAPLDEPVRLLLSDTPVRRDDPFLRHKTSHRARWDHAWREAERQGAFDMLFFNEDGALTEGGRCNVFVRIDGRWLTPALDCGLLPGVMRGRLLADATLNAREAVIRRADLRRADAVLVCNALRGVLTAQIVGDSVGNSVGNSVAGSVRA